MINKITKITRNIKWHEMWNDTECQMTQNVKWHEMSNDTEWQMTQNEKFKEMTQWHMSHDT